MSIWLAFAGTFITSLLALIGVLWTAAQSRKAAAETARAEAAARTETARTAPYDQLAARVSQLEPLVPRVEKLERDQRIDRNYIRTLLAWIGHHAPELRAAVPPAPSWYEDTPPGSGA